MVDRQVKGNGKKSLIMDNLKKNQLKKNNPKKESVKLNISVKQHKDLHQHVNPHLDHKEVPKGSYHPEGKKIHPMLSKGRLDWIWTKIKLGKFHPFPLVMILLLFIPLFVVLLLALGVKLPFSFTNIPILKNILNYVGIYSDKDLFVNATWVYWWPIFIGTIFIFKRIWCGGFCPFGLMTDIGNFLWA